MGLACSSGPRQPPAPAVTPVMSKEILNARLSGSIGPDLGNLGKLIEPASLLVNNIGDIFITDRAVNAICKISSDLIPQSREGGLGGFGGGYNRPMGMASDAALNIYIADGGNRRIQVFDHNMRFVKIIDGYENDKGESAQFVSPSDVAIDNAGNIWIADEDRVLKLDPFLKLLFEASEKAAGQFILGRVSAIEISMNGTVAIADAGNNRIITMSVYGNYISDFAAGSATVIAWDPRNNIWAANQDRGRISNYDVNGNLIFAFSDDAGSKPVGISFDRDGRLLVLDRNQRRLKIYELIRGAERTGQKAR